MKLSDALRRPIRTLLTREQIYSQRRKQTSQKSRGPNGVESTPRPSPGPRPSHRALPPSHAPPTGSAAASTVATVAAALGATALTAVAATGGGSAADRRRERRPRRSRCPVANGAARRRRWRRATGGGGGEGGDDSGGDGGTDGGENGFGVSIAPPLSRLLVTHLGQGRVGGRGQVKAALWRARAGGSAGARCARCVLALACAGAGWGVGRRGRAPCVGRAA